MPSLATFFDLLLVILGFGLIIVIHELGHFLAARWAGVRVLAFAVGVGKPVVSYRRGRGGGGGSSEGESPGQWAREGQAGGMSPTEYRFCWLPFGGYVKMLGQEDANPGAVSRAPDSYQNCPIWKRMVIISAGVVANVITAMLLFVFVFMVGLKSEPAKIGGVFVDGPAAKAVATNASEAGVSERGLKPGDVVVSVNGAKPRHFNDLNLAVVMAAKDKPVRMKVQRPGVEALLEFEVVPEVDEVTKLLAIGVTPARDTRIIELKREQDREALAEALSGVGLEGVGSGMELVRAGDRQEIRDAQELATLARQSETGRLRVVFQDRAGGEIQRELDLIPEMELGAVKVGEDREAVIDHLLGLTPVMRVADAGAAAKQGLQTGDIFLRLGAVEFPSMAAGTAEINARKRGTIEAVVLRGSSDGVGGEEVALTLKVNAKGRVGFGVGDTGGFSTLLAQPPATLRRNGAGEPGKAPAGLAFEAVAGARIVAVDGREVGDFAELREALMAATRAAFEAKATVASVQVRVLPPGPGGTEEERELTLTGEDLAALHALSWRLPMSLDIFGLEEILVRGSDPVESMMIGLSETRRVMITTYLTFARLFQGTVKIEHLKGPVGIAHLGTRIAERGAIWLLFFLGLVSINLAVINFLPLPLLDGGQFLMLLYEQARGRPVPMAVQEAISLVGILLIGAMFLLVTYNDIMGLFA